MTIKSFLSASIDHTYLKPETTLSDIERVCAEAKMYGFAGVCIPPRWVAFAAQQLSGTAIQVVTVVGFPFGYQTLATKVEETRQALQDGATEIDMVIPIGALKCGQDEQVRQEIDAIVDAAAGKTVKVIVESGVLTLDEKKRAAEIVKRSRARFIKTSTGFNGPGASVEDVALFKKILGTAKEIKASGGIRTQADAEKMIAAGATRIGTSSGIAITEGKNGSGSY